jgi:ABC-type iron transport system FetAB ATPase subunit
MALLSVRDLKAGYGKLEILHGVSLDVEEGSITALIGANGAGKTTLMRALAGLIPVRGGALVYRGEDLSASPAHARVERGVTLVPEGRMVFASLTVLQNLRLGAISKHARAGADRRLAEVCRRYPRLAERSSQRAGSLSGGEQQMLAIGRGLMAAPKSLRSASRRSWSNRSSRPSGNCDRKVMRCCWPSRTRASRSNSRTRAASSKAAAFGCGEQAQILRPRKRSARAISDFEAPATTGGSMKVRSMSMSSRDFAIAAHPSGAHQPARRSFQSVVAPEALRDIRSACQEG